MEIITILKANIRRQKGSFFGIFILMMIVSMALTAVLTVSMNSQKSDEEALEQAGFGDMLVLLNGSGETYEELMRQVEEQKEVEKILITPALAGDFLNINGKVENNSVMMAGYSTSGLNYRIFNEEGTGYQEKPEVLREGEMYVPISYKTLYGCETGDKISLNMEGESTAYTIKGFFEDPFMGSSMMGVKTVLLSDKDLEKMLQSCREEKSGNSFSEAVMLNIFRKKSSDLSYLRFQQELNKNTGVEGYAWLSLGKEQAISYMLILVRIFSGSLLVFIALLLIITLIIMNHSIGSSIEMEYVNLGILKAVGVTQRKLKMILMLQYLLGAALGAALGIPLAIPVIRLVNRIMTPVVGILTPGALAMLPCFVALLGIMAFIVLFIWIKLRKMKNITPVQAISGGKESVYFSSRLEMPIRKRGMSLWLAFRQLTSNGKQYISAGVITGLLVFFMIMMGHMDAWVGEDGEQFSRAFDVVEYDLWVHCYNDEIQEEVEGTIESYSEIEKSFYMQNTYLLLDGCQIQCFISGAPEEIESILEGRTCLYDNEILVTEFVAKQLEIQIGDTVTVALNDEKAEYMISGIYQCANDMGSNFAMSKAAYERLALSGSTGEKTVSMGKAYRLADGGRAKEIAEKLSQVYGSELSVSASNGFNGMDSIVAAVNALSLLVYVLTVIFALVVISLVCGKIFAKERQDYGIYKAFGFTSKNLRLQFAMRFMIVSLLGSVLGVILTVLLMNKCFEMLLSYVGISRVEMEIAWMSVLSPIVMMAVVFFLFSYWKAGKIKRVQARILISE